MFPDCQCESYGQFNVKVLTDSATVNVGLMDDVGVTVNVKVAQVARVMRVAGIIEVAGVTIHKKVDHMHNCTF